MKNPIKAIKNLFGKGTSMNTEKANWFKDEIGKTRYKDRIGRVTDIDDYLRREHKVLQIPSFEFKEHTFEPTRLVLQTLKSIIKFHSSYVCGSPVSITGDKEFVSLLNTIYKKGGYTKTDLEIAKDLITYGDTFEYVYLDENNNIRSKIIRNKDSYPLYDSFGNYTNFVEYWKDEDTRKDHYIVYYPDKVEIYEGSKLVDTKNNLTGLPIWYSAMDKSKYDKFGDPFPLDLIGIMDTIEALLSKLDTAVTTLSLSPLGVVSGQRMDSAIPTNIVGTVMNLEDGATFNWANAQMDRESIKLELDYVIQQFYAIACVPASIMGQSNVANVSETSITMLYQQCDNFARQYIASMREGFEQRLAYIRKLMEYNHQTVSDEVFDSINFSFNVARPVDNAADMENMQIQYNCGAISKQTIIDRSPYTTDTALELKRIEDETNGTTENSAEVPTDNPTEDDPQEVVTSTKTEETVLDDKVD